MTVLDTPTMTPDQACRELDAQLAKLQQAARDAQEALRGQESALEPLRARRRDLVAADGPLDGLMTEVTSLAFDLESGEVKIGFLTDRLEALKTREQAVTAQREATWIAADRPGFDAELRRLHADVAMADARFRGVALAGWEAVPRERRRWEPRWQGAINAATLERLVWPTPSGQEYAAYLAERSAIAERAKTLQSRALRHRVPITIGKPLTAVTATIQAIESKNPRPLPPPPAGGGPMSAKAMEIAQGGDRQ